MPILACSRAGSFCDFSRRVAHSTSPPKVSDNGQAKYISIKISTSSKAGRYRTIASDMTNEANPSQTLNKDNIALPSSSLSVANDFVGQSCGEEFGDHLAWHGDHFDNVGGYDLLLG